MAAKVRTPEGKALYARRKVVVEPVFGQIKEARGFRRFLLRGLEKVRGEWRLVCLTHNLLKIWRYAARIRGGCGCAVTTGGVAGVMEAENRDRSQVGQLSGSC